MAAGEPIRLVRAAAGVSESASRRHLRNHLAPAVLAARRSTFAIKPADFAERLLRGAEEATLVREHARHTNDGRLLLAAIAQERESLLVVMNRLGIDSDETLSFLREARAFVVAVQTVVRDRPEVLADLVAELYRHPDGAASAAALSKSHMPTSSEGERHAS